MTSVADDLRIRPLTARSAILSVLLGTHPAEAAGADIVAWGLRIGLGEPAVRVALTRMVAGGDLERRDGVHALTPRLLERQRWQDRMIEQAAGPWDGSWIVAVTTAVGADAASRGQLRQAMLRDRFGELREGVWMRPATPDWSPQTGVADRVEVMSAVPSRPAADLAATLFDADAWAATATALLDLLARTDGLRERIAVAAAIVRHLVTDPLLPSELLPADWPGERLRSTYRGFRLEVEASWSVREP